MLVVSVHDVAPSTLPQVRWLLSRLDAVGVRPRVLHVIPCEAGVADIRDDPALGALLRAEVEAGSEIGLHGYTHRAAGPPRGDSLTRIRARLFARGTAEFASLDRDEMARRIAEGQHMLDELGLHPTTFCAPAWLSTSELPALLRAAGFRYLTSFTAVHDLAAQRRHFLPASGYLGSTRTTEALTHLGSSLGQLVARSNDHRIFLHPQGASASGDCARVLRQIEQLRRSHEAVTNGHLCDA